MADGSDAPQLRALLTEQIERGDVQVEELGHLTQRAMQRIAKVHRFRQRLGDGIQYQELPVAAPDFEFRLLALGNIEQETLVRYYVAGGIADRDGRLQHGAYFAVLAPHFEFEIGYFTVLLQEPFEPFAIGAFGIERGRNVDPHELLAVLIAGHSKKSVVEIQEAPLGRGDKHAFLNAGDERTVFFLRAFSIGDVLQDVDGSELHSTGIRKRGIGGQEIAGQPRIGLVTFPADSLAVRATLVGSILHGEEFHDASAGKCAPLAPQELAEPLIAAQNASREIVDQDRVANGIESVFPLTLHGSDLFKQANVLERQAEQVRDVDKVGKLIRVKPPLARRTDGDDSQWPLLAGKRQSDERFQSGFVDPPSSNGIPLLVGLQELALSLHHLLRPGLHRGQFGIASQERLVEPHRCPRHELRGIPFAFLQPHDAMCGGKTLHEMRQNLVNHFLDRKRLRARGGQERQAAHLVVQFFASRARTFQDDYHHGDSQGHSQKVVEGHAQQEKRAIQPERTIQPMHSTQQEYPCKELRSVAVARQLRPPHHPAGKQTKYRLENGGLPMQRSDLLRASPLDIVDGCQDQAQQRNRRPDLPLRS